MKTPKGQKRNSRRWRRRTKGGITRLTSAQRAFPVEAMLPANHDEGVLRIESETGRLPAALVEAGDSSEPGIKPGGLVLLITAVALAFIIIITWFIAQMPTK